MVQKKPTSPARTQAQRRSESEDKLIEAACEVLARKGLVGMTLAEVGQRAGVSRGLAAHYFSSKAGLVHALTQRINKNFETHMRRVPTAAPGLARILQFIDVYLGRKDQKWTTTRTLLLLIAESLTANSENAPVLAKYEEEMFKYLQDNIQFGIDAGEIHGDVSPRVGAEMIIGSLRGMMLQRLVEKETVDASDIQEQMLRLVERALATNPRNVSP